MLSVGDKESWILRTLMWFVAKFTVERNAHSQLKVSENKNVNVLGFPDSSAGKESACNAGDPGLIPGLGSSPGEGIGYPLQHSWASWVAQMVKNLPAVWETWVQSLGWEDPLEEGMATYSSILAWRIPMDRGACWATVHGVAKSQT